MENQKLTNIVDIIRVLHELSDDEEDEFVDDVEVHDDFELEENPNDADRDTDDNCADPDFKSPDKEEVEQIIISDIGNLERPSGSERGIGKKRPRSKSEKTDSLVIVESPVLFGKDGTSWKTKCSDEKRKTPSRNIVHVRPGPTPTTKFTSDPVECFNLFISQNIVNEILVHTNNEILRQREKYKSNADPSLKDVSVIELRALFGLLLTSAALKSNHLSTEILFDTAYCGERFRATMSRTRFNFLINCLRFDDKSTRTERLAVTKFAPISKIWELFLENCRVNYKPGSYLTIDEQLVAFRGRCGFRMYIPSKPDRYGIKLVLICDNSTKYMVDGRPYLGKGTAPNDMPCADFFVQELTKSIKGSNRNVTLDNWFTSINLVSKLLKEKITVIGTIKKNKRELPAEFTDIKYLNRKPGTSLFLYSDSMTLVSYKPKINKLVTLVSSAHFDSAINETSNKPEIVLNYNQTKGAVDSFDQMCHNMNCGRKTKRWPLCIFYNMLNAASINAFVVYVHNFYKSHNNEKPLNRLNFMLNLGTTLTEPWRKERLELKNISKELRSMISGSLGIPEEVQSNESIGEQQSLNRKYCKYCDYKKKKE